MPSRVLVPAVIPLNPSCTYVDWGKKKKDNLKVKSYDLFRDLIDDDSLGISLSDSSKELLWRVKRRVRIHRSFSIKHAKRRK